ncbi:MAG: DUF4038 domain-containing protein [Hyphomonadaceae bacterium]
MLFRPNRRAFSLGAASILAACGARSEHAAAEETPNEFPQAQFPLRVEGRHLVDAAGRPFLLHGDTSWSMIAELTRENTEFYLQDRRARGFNTLLVNLIEPHFSRNPPLNAYGERPFRNDRDFTTINEAYFAHADWQIRRAGELGFFVMLVPAYLGYNGGEEGWYRLLLDNGERKLRQYGRLMAERYLDAPNILWMQGGDYNPPQRWTVTAIVEGMKEVDQRHLMSAHAGPETPALAEWAGANWIDLNTLYTYRAVTAGTPAEYARGKPFILIESGYENAPRSAETRRLRTQPFHALLGGACGHMYGNADVWHYDGPGLYPPRTSWQEALNSDGARWMTIVRRFFESIPWTTLRPDPENDFLRTPPGDGQNASAVARNEGMAVLYFPTPRVAEIELPMLAGPRIAARWFDPMTGRAHPERIIERPARMAINPEAELGAAFRNQDWVLVLESRPA